LDIGITLMLSDQTVSVDDAATAVEERGFESFWLGEHTHMPVDTVHRYTSGEKYGKGTVTKDGYLPEYYKRVPDPYVMLTAAAMATTTLRIGTCIALPAEHNPITLAKVIATLDHLSGGRFEFGVGYGWNPLEMANNGFEMEQRHEVMREKILAMKALWTQETAACAGEFVSFTETWSYPKPLQQPHPPILVGAAATKRNIEDIVDWGDGWMPVRVFMGDEKLGSDIARVRQRAEEAGRNPADIQITLVDTSGAMSGKRSQDAFLRRMPTRKDLELFASLGIRRLSLGPPVHDRDFFLWALDQFADLIEPAAAL
jgi:probable F420-dependent oxidoreductase